jgi:hypothetical protein
MSQGLLANQDKTRRAVQILLETKRSPSVGTHQVTSLQQWQQLSLSQKAAQLILLMVPDPFLQMQSSPVSETRTPCSQGSTAERSTVYPMPTSHSVYHSHASSESMPNPKPSTQRCCSAACARSREAPARQRSRRRKAETPGSPTMPNLMPCRRSPKNSQTK